MSGSWFTENFSDFSDEFFDDLGDIKYYDTALDDVEANDAGEDWETKLQNLEPPPLSFLAGFSFSIGFENGKNDLKVKKTSVVPCDETLQHKQWPADGDLCSKCPPLPDSSDGKYVHTLRTCSPVSVLESSSSSSSSAENPMPCFPKFDVPVKRPRSKRCYTPRRTFPSITFPSASRRYRRLTAPESDSGFYIGNLALEAVKKSQQKKKNLTRIPSGVEATESSDSGETRKCTHCQVTKTPQWREGPMGPKTLCNACGVRYRSGRLFPEYRPAASPTFVPSVHSNSHRKVLEMRKKAGRLTASAVMAPPVVSAAEYSF